MSTKNLHDILRDILDGLKKFFTSRVTPFIVLAIALFVVLVYRLFVLQIVKGQDYSESYVLKTEKTISTAGTRGNIYDCNGKLLAYNEMAYSVVIEDCGYYDSTKIKNATLNKIISDTIDIIESHDNQIDYDFPIKLGDDNEYYFTIDGDTLYRYLRDVYGRKSIGALSDDEKNSTADDVMKTFSTRYKINSNYNKNKAMQIAYIRYNLAANSYKRYISFTVASVISNETMAAIVENEDILTGVTIAETTIRKYNDSEAMAHIIGYTGKANTEELAELQAENDSYEANDIVGKAGIEKTYETTLAGTKGSVTMLVDSVGRVQETTNVVEALPGNDVYLTIDIDLQEKIYHLMERRLAETLLTRISVKNETMDNNHIMIPIDDVYFALIDNNTIDIDKIASSDSPTAMSVYNSFTAYKATVADTINNELNTGTVYSALSEDMQKYIKLIRSNLINTEILNVNIMKSDSDSDLAKNWTNGSISFTDYLRGAVDAGWVNIYNLDINSEYPTTDEVVSSLYDTIISQIDTNKELDKSLYSYLIKNHLVSGRDICLILMEQDAIPFTAEEFASIAGGASTADYILGKIKSLDITPAMLALDPCSGSCVLENPNDGTIMALISYPGYDNNKFSGSIDSSYYSRLLADKSTPLVNRATMTKIAPGSTFKPVTAIAGLNEGVIGINDTVFCDGVFDTISPPIKCWVYPAGHGALSVVGALEHSCNVYFCEIGYRLCLEPSGKLNYALGLQRLQKYTDLLGLSTKTGIQIPEAMPHATDFNAVASSIGQGTNAYTSLNLARYVSTVANFGTVYNSSLVQKTINYDGSNEEKLEPVIDHTAEISQDIWNAVHQGMQQVITKGVMSSLAAELPAKVYGKSGTAEEDKTRANHACYVMYTSDNENKPEAVATVMLPYGYAATNAGIMAYYALASYYGIDIEDEIYFNVMDTLTFSN